MAVSIPLSGVIPDYLQDELDKKADIYVFTPEAEPVSIGELSVGDSVQGWYFTHLSISGTSPDTLGHSQDLITFSDGYKLIYVDGGTTSGGLPIFSYQYNDPSGQLRKTIYDMDGKIGAWHSEAFSIEGTGIITEINPILSTISFGRMFQLDPRSFPDVHVDCEYNYSGLQEHIENDKGYWETLLSVQNISKANQAVLMQQQYLLNEFLVRISVLEENPIEPPPVYDMSNPLVLKTPPLLGLLGIEVGGINLIGSGWEVQSNGKIVIDGASAIGLLTPTWIAKNGENLDPMNPLAVLTIIGGGNSGEFTVVTGDVITESGMGNITFYPEV